MKAMRIKTIITTLMLMVSMGMTAQTKTVQTDEYKDEVRAKLQLDYSMPDYSTSKIDSKVIGLRLAKILNKMLEMSKNGTNLSTLSVIQGRQIEGLNYCIIKSLKLNKIVKRGNELTLSFDTTLKENAKNLKKAQLVFNFFDGVSDDVATNDFFANICRYIKE